LRYAEARVDFGDSGQVTPSTAARELNGETYRVLTPAEYDFFAATGQLSERGRYVIEDEVMSSGNKLILINTGLMNTFELAQPAMYPFGQKVRIYVEITKVNDFFRYEAGRNEPALRYVEARVRAIETIAL
jgi:hypothetical protein